MTLQETNKIYRKQADYFETVSPILLRVRGRTADEYERLYLAAWEEVYQKYPHYLYKDDRFCDEFGPARSEDVSALSYKRTAADVKQARANTAHTLAEQDERRFAASTDNTYRPMLADLLKKAAQQLTHHMPVFEALNDIRFAPVLPPVYSSTPDRAVDEPETVGGALGLLDYFIDLHEKFLRTEEGGLAAAQPDSPALDTPASQAIAESSQPGSLAPNRGYPHLGDTLDTVPPAALTVGDLCRDGFTPDDVLALAREVGLADEAGRFCLSSRKLGAVVGFCKALGGDAKGVTAAPLAGTIPERVRAVGVMLGVEIRTSKTGTGVAEKYRRATERALAGRKPTH